MKDNKQVLDKTEIAKYDSSGMLNLILNFPEQLQDALEISKSTQVHLISKKIQNICIVGMGGSAITGDLLRSYVTDLKVPLQVCRNYVVPAFVNENSLAVISSYSGNTEETLTAYDEICRRGAQVVAITSGGQLAEKALLNGHQHFLIPSGFPPRTALGYLFVPLLYSLFYTGIISNPENGIFETIELIRHLSEKYHPDAENNSAKQISHLLQNRIPLILAASGSFDSVALRWKCQFCENSEVLAFHSAFPEINHNEIMGWSGSLNQVFKVIYLKDRDDHHRVKLRMSHTKRILEKSTDEIIEVESQGNSLFARIFSLIFLGDMISLYLAVLNKVDPTSIKNIEDIKRQLGQI